jgi:hypothetical protein
MTDTTYTITLRDSGIKAFTMPQGYWPDVEIQCWGAGGGAGRGGAQGGGGGYAYTTANIAAGDEVSLQIGQPGGNANGMTGGSPGLDPTYRLFRGGRGGNAYDEDNDSGASGGGGGASWVAVEGTIVCAGAGGGGAGGLGDDGAGRPGRAGLPGGVYVGSQSGIYAVTLSYAWNNFMNSYAVWGNGNDYTVTLNFPVTGIHTFNYAVDNYGQVFLDGNAIITLSGSSSSHYSTTTTYTANVAAGNHTIRVTGVNTGGPAGVAAQILKPDTTELWNTRVLLTTSGLNTLSEGADAYDAGSPGGGSGGGYPYGGGQTIGYGDDAGAAPGGNGGQNYGNLTIAGSGIFPGGRTASLYPGQRRGEAGYPGYITLVLRKKLNVYTKNAGNWVGIQSAYVKVGEARPSVVSDTRTFNTIGTSTYVIPNEIRSLTISYITPNGIVSQIIPVTSGGILPVTVGDVGQTSSFGDFTMPANSKQVFQYIGNVDHLLNADVQIANASGNPLTIGGYNAGQTAAAAAAGLYYNVTYEGWHGDLYSTLNFNPVAIGNLTSKFQIVASGGGRAGAPAVTVQPTVANGYIMSIQFYDGGGGEGSYNGIFTLQQQGNFTISYDLPIVISPWKQIQQAFTKVGDQWQPILTNETITLYNKTT